MHEHTDECWEPDSGCDMGRNEQFAVAVPRSFVDNPSVIVEVAIKHEDTVYAMGPPMRHHDIIRMLVEDFGHEAPISSSKGYVQGFLDADGNFLTREQAAAKLGRTGKLFSEDLW